MQFVPRLPLFAVVQHFWIKLEAAVRVAAACTFVAVCVFRMTSLVQASGTNDLDMFCFPTLDSILVVVGRRVVLLAG